jgi:FkbM family methyltransferase
MISYAGNHEDVLLRRAFAGSPRGFYIDVGAHHPAQGSLTKHFYDQGWTGINIEPLSSLFSAFPAARERDINLNAAVSNCCGQMPLFEVQGDPSLSTLCRSQAADHAQAGHSILERPVTVCTLASVCERYAPAVIDFLSIDVEGHEREVLEGADFTRWRPRVLIIEAIKPWSTETTHSMWEHHILDAAYQHVLFDGVNRVYVREEDRQLAPLLAVPVNSVDRYVDHGTVVLQQEIADLQRKQLRSAVPRLARRVVHLLKSTASLGARAHKPRQSQIAARAPS